MNYIIYKSGIWNDCLDLFKRGVNKGSEFDSLRKRQEYQHIAPSKEVFVANSRYLHRGYFCPSPIADFLYDNARRGKILSRPTKKSNITNHYLYNNRDELYLVNYFNNRSPVSKEYLLTENNIRYGFVFGREEILGGVSAEVYDGNRIQSYMWAKCYKIPVIHENWQAERVRYETYTYDESGLSFVDLHYIALIEEEYSCPADALSLVEHIRYRTVCENDRVVSIERA